MNVNAPGRTVRFTHPWAPAGGAGGVGEAAPGRLVCIVHGDLTEEPVDAIVNAANEQLAHGGGVAGAIVRKGGRSIQEESDRWVAAHGPVATGSAAVTGGGNLHARIVVHAVGPIWEERGDEPALLAAAVGAALAVADAHGCASVSLPAISTGIFGFPKPLAAVVILDAIERWLAASPAAVREVNVTNWDEETVAVLETEARRRWTGGR